MTYSTQGYPQAAAISPRLQVAATAESTNAKLLADAAAHPGDYPHLSVVLTRDQRAGRGRLDRTWITPPGTALAVSVLLRVGSVAVADRGWIPLLAGAAMTRAIGNQLPGVSVGLKWPNDVLVDGRKICGILVQVMPEDPQTVVVGAGVNTTMDAAELPVPTATSFAALGAEADEDRLLADYLTALRDSVADLAVRGGAGVAPGVAEVCTTLGREVRAELPDGTAVTGTAQRLDDQGRLVLLTAAGTEQPVAAADIVHLH